MTKETFVPHPALCGGHRMTVYGWGNPRHFPMLPKAVPRYFDVDHDARVVAACHWQRRPWECATIVVLHGLNASSDAHYVRGIAAKAFARGMNVVRLNQRNCGNTEHLSASLFHSGLTADVAYVIDELTAVDGLPSISLAGYSLGGNLALKLAGEYGQLPPPPLRSVAAVSPILEIGACVDALERRENLLYQWNFVRDLKRRMRRKNRFWPDRFDLSKLGRIRTVREFDDAYTAPSFGFRDADDYYFRASAMRVIDRVAVPALIITAEDDPFVPSAPFRDAKLSGNRHITLRICRHGGHCGFVGTRTGSNDDGYWAETQIIEFVERWGRSDTPARGQATLAPPPVAPLPTDPSAVSPAPGPFLPLRA